MLKRRAVLLLMGGLMACDGVYRVVVPYCPVSDSAWAAADSVPVLCLRSDSTRALP